MKQASLLSAERTKFHKHLCKKLLVMDKFKIKSGKQKGSEVFAATNADAEQPTSRSIANSIAMELGAVEGKRLAAQTSGDEFETAVSDFLLNTFPQLFILRPGDWAVRKLKGRNSSEFERFEQYQHLLAVRNLVQSNKEAAAALGNDYLISPDVVVLRNQEKIDKINRDDYLIDEKVAKSSAILDRGKGTPILHASISCKWTIRSDRAQNSRSEALNLIRNRKGRTPHIAVVTGEPLPSRLSSLCLGTGDIDCVYHFALYELQRAVAQQKQSEAQDILSLMVDGGRLKDISDLPLDLTV